MDFQIRHQIGQPFGPSPSLSKNPLIHHAFPMTIRVTSEILAYSCNLQGNVLAVASLQSPALLCSARRICFLQPCMILRRFLCRFRGLHIQCCKISTKCPGHLCRSPDNFSLDGEMTDRTRNMFFSLCFLFSFFPNASPRFQL